MTECQARKPSLIEHGGLVDRIVSITESFDSFVTEDLPHEILRVAYEGWKKAGSGERGNIPHIRKIDVMLLEQALPHCAIVHTGRGAGFRPQYLHVGNALNTLYGEPLWGKYLDEVFSPYIRQEPLQAYVRVATSGNPLFTRRMARTFMKIRGYDRLILPLQDEEGHISYTLLCLIPNDKTIIKAQDWREAEDLKGWISQLEQLP